MTSNDIKTTDLVVVATWRLVNTFGSHNKAYEGYIAEHPTEKEKFVAFGLYGRIGGTMQATVVAVGARPACLDDLLARLRHKVANGYEVQPAGKELPPLGKESTHVDWTRRPFRYGQGFLGDARPVVDVDQARAHPARTVTSFRGALSRR